MKKHANIPIFIPHLGCPNQCVFCNQRKITGQSDFSVDSVRNQIENALNTIADGVDTEIAFFGGSFTGIDYDLMCDLLSVAYSYVESGDVTSIRCSTRPDYINEKILSTLKKYGVKVIELGLQSIDDTVLLLSKRGHTSDDAIKACDMIVKNGFSLVGQMMIGLPGSDELTEERTARFIIESGASSARIYPTVVFRETELCDMAADGRYSPITVDEAIKRSSKILQIFRESNVNVIRIGLCANENLSDENSYYSGPNHPALGELVENEYYYNLIRKSIKNTNILSGSALIVETAIGTLSKAIGQNKKNKLRLMSDFGFKRILFKESSDVLDFDIRIKYEERID